MFLNQKDTMNRGAQNRFISMKESLVKCWVLNAFVVQKSSINNELITATATAIFTAVGTG